LRLGATRLQKQATGCGSSCGSSCGGQGGLALSQVVSQHLKTETLKPAPNIKSADRTKLKTSQPTAQTTCEPHPPLRITP